MSQGVHFKGSEGVPSSSVGVKRRTVVIRLVYRDTAAGVSVDLPIAIGSSERASLGHRGSAHGAA